MKKKKEKKKLGLTKDQKFVFAFMLAIIIILSITLTWTNGYIIAEFIREKQAEATGCFPEYDINGDGIVNFVDCGLIWDHRTTEGNAYDAIYDMDCDNDVDEEDSNICWGHRN